jgi:hypothetical protein
MPQEPPEPVLTPRLRMGFGLLAFGIGLMFLAGKVLPDPVPAGIAGGITLAIVGFAMVIVEALREPTSDPAPPDDRADGSPDAPQPPDPR